MKLFTAALTTLAILTTNCFAETTTYLTIKSGIFYTTDMSKKIKVHSQSKDKNTLIVSGSDPRGSWAGVYSAQPKEEEMNYYSTYHGTYYGIGFIDSDTLYQASLRGNAIVYYRAGSCQP